MLDQIRIVVERFPDGYVAYPLGVRGVVVGQGQTEEDAIADCRSALRFHVETFGPDEIDPVTPIETHLVVSAF
jgi:predicted RNase H-like HicB family nuclease